MPSSPSANERSEMGCSSGGDESQKDHQRLDRTYSQSHLGGLMVWTLPSASPKLQWEIVSKEGKVVTLGCEHHGRNVVLICSSHHRVSSLTLDVDFFVNFFFSSWSWAAQTEQCGPNRAGAAGPSARRALLPGSLQSGCSGLGGSGDYSAGSVQAPHTAFHRPPHHLVLST